MIGQLTKEILKGVQRVTLGDFKATDDLTERQDKLRVIPANTPDAIRDKLLVLINTGWLVVSNMRVLLDYVEAWTYRDFEFIKNNSLAVLAMLNQETEYEDDKEWLLLLGSVERDINRFLTESNR